MWSHKLTLNDNICIGIFILHFTQFAFRILEEIAALCPLTRLASEAKRKPSIEYNIKRDIQSIHTQVVYGIETKVVGFEKKS